MKQREDFFKDSFRAYFGADQEDELNTFVQEIMKESKWEKVDVDDLQISLLENNPIVLSLDKDYYKNTYGISSSEEAINDTMESTAHLLKVDSQTFLVRDTAIPGIFSRAKISGSALTKLNNPDYVNTINLCLGVWKKQKALLLIRGEKLTACQAGDEHDYSILPMDQLLSTLKNMMNRRFPGYKFMSGYYQHDLLRATWNMPKQSGPLLRKYKDALDRYSKKDFLLNTEPSITFSTGDTGSCGAHIVACLYKDGSPVNIGSPMSLSHKNGASIDNFAELVDGAFSMFADKTEALATLLDVTIDYPISCMLHIAKKLGLPKKACMQAIEAFETINGNNQSNAHDLYWALYETVFILKIENKTKPDTLFKIEEDIARALSMRWSDYDLPYKPEW